ncbi:hypothetical protein PR048_002091 [Dryococelus australis]|uniref:Uncharacterized protein n=1 Tax=Dryococelus australis TaxID=614101 RepID=A0ABQ9IJ92_9NEOP|nr:hypothetical protein PR048_002091 [Dryococelus australis]
MKLQTCICDKVLEIQMHMQQVGFMQEDFLCVSYQAMCIFLSWTSDFVEQVLCNQVNIAKNRTVGPVVMLSLASLVFHTQLYGKCGTWLQCLSQDKLHSRDHRPCVKFYECYNEQC